MEEKGALAGTLSLSGIIEYQDDAVVSKIVLKKSTGSVTVFAFDQGQELSEHTVPHDALVQVFDGEAQITISGEEHRVMAGEMIVMPGNQPHAVKASERFKMLLIMIRS